MSRSALPWPIAFIPSGEVALDPEGAGDRLSRLWPRITRRTVFPGGLLAHARTLRQARMQFFPDTGLVSVITDHLRPDSTVDALTLPFGGVTTDVATAAPYLIMQGRLVPALQASAAIPGIFPAVTVDGRQAYDGRVVADVPVTQALEMGHRLSPLSIDHTPMLISGAYDAAKAFLKQLQIDRAGLYGSPSGR